MNDDTTPEDDGIKAERVVTLCQGLIDATRPT